MPPRQPDPHLIVMMGGTGDLAGRKLLPALYQLARQDLLGPSWQILAVARSADLDDAGYRIWAREQLAGAGFGTDDLPGWCDQCLHYACIGKGTPEDYGALAQKIATVEKGAGLPGNRIFYLSLPPVAFAPTIAGLGEAQLGNGPGWTRLVIEKPFGHDLQSAQHLNAIVHGQFSEDQVYRIDHYLGKETVQNLMVFRFGNTIFEDLWNRDRIESVQITVAEDLGVEDRAGFYETTGAVRDVIQNHLAQLLALVAMEVPLAYDAQSIRHEKLKVIRSIRPVLPEHVVFAQYTAGNADARVIGYREEDGVASDSGTETYAALRLDLDTWRWQGVPFFIRTGKRLQRKLTQIAVTFRRPPVFLFESMGTSRLQRNCLFITLQPDEGFSLLLDVKSPGEPFTLQQIPLGFRYADQFGDLPDAYQTLLLDVLLGDQALFVHADEVEASWRLFDPVLSATPQIQTYPAGSWGPSAADQLLARDGQIWQMP